MKMQPLYARVLLKRDRIESKVVIIPDTARARNAPTRGTVVAKGETADASIRVGGVYLFGQHAGTWLTADGRPAGETDDAYFIVQDEDLLAEVTE